METALRRIIAMAPDLEPDPEDYDDTEAASARGIEAGAWEAAKIARQALGMKAMPAVTIRAADLRTGDLLDLEGDPIADPDGAVPFKAEYFAVTGREMEKPDCCRVDFDDRSVRFPPDHPVKLAPLGRDETLAAIHDDLDWRDGAEPEPGSLLALWIAHHGIDWHAVKAEASKATE